MFDYILLCKSHFVNIIKAGNERKIHCANNLLKTPHRTISTCIGWENKTVRR